MSLQQMKSLAIFSLALALMTTTLAADQMLFDFRTGIDRFKIGTTDALISPAPSAAGSVLRITTRHQESWPGITLQAPDGHLDLAAFAQVTLQVRNAGTNPVTLYCRVDNPGADGTHHCVTGSLTLAPGKGDTLKVFLRRANDDTLGGKLFGMRGYPAAPGGDNTVDVTNITQLLVFVNKPDADHVFEISAIRATGNYIAPTAWVADASPFTPFVDAFGQYAHKDWPGKTHSLVELTARRDAEAKELSEQPGPNNWDQYGGWLDGPKRQATGFFRTEKFHGHWWLIDPDGHLFFSNGIDCVGMRDVTPIEDRERWFRDFPGQQTEFTGFYSTGYSLKGHYAGRTVKCYSFAEANLRRKYGADWRAVYPKLLHQRLRSWGINTIGNWSDEATRRMNLTPYTDAISSDGTKKIEGSKGYWGKFPDVFDPSFEESLQRSMEGKRGKSANDAWCIGYFSDNEMSWGDDLSVAIAALESPPDQAAKKVFIADLKLKYGELARLNQAWETHYLSWEALEEDRIAPDRKKSKDDLAAFHTKAAEQYFRTVRDTIKAIAPHQLYLGCRFAEANARATAAAAKYCDVVSFNLYHHSVADFQFTGGADVPLIIGEFHFGALDRGMFHTGLVPVTSQSARAAAYEEYVKGALRHPQFVGCHCFQYQDEPLTGRSYDEENYQIGFIDVADTPYQETIEASRKVGHDLYHESNRR